MTGPGFSSFHPSLSDLYLISIIMKVVSLQFSICNLTSHSPLLPSSNKFSLSLKPRIQIPNRLAKPTRISAKAVPARDRIIDFGKHKGRMLGTLPSSYLRWVSDNLRARDFEDWAKLADEVLGDPVYRDRIEWESAEKVLNGDVSSRSSSMAGSVGAVSELLEISERFGWDNEDKVGWSKVDFGLLGTSRGGRIPRRVSEKRELGFKREKVDCSSCDGEEAKKRRERRERVRAKSIAHTKVGFAEEKIGVDEVVFGNGNEEDLRGNSRSPFPGRESLLKKVLNNRSRRPS